MLFIIFDAIIFRFAIFATYIDTLLDIVLTAIDFHTCHYLRHLRYAALILAAIYYADYAYTPHDIILATPLRHVIITADAYAG